MTISQDPSKQNHHSRSKISLYFIASWILAAFGGLVFGCVAGISGGVSLNDDFLKKFFPDVYRKKHEDKGNNYCKFDDQILQLFTSSLYLAALVASFGASRLCSLLGRKPTILMASASFILGAVMSAFAYWKWMLIIGRNLFGIGIGLGNESIPLFLTEIAPIRHRGTVYRLFQLFVTIGVLIANLVNYGTQNLHPHGWRISLGLAGIPAIFLLIGSWVVTETPASLVERGKEAEGREALKKIRGVDDVEVEFEQIKLASEIAKLIKHPYKKLMKRTSMPTLIITILLQIFKQFTGINSIMFYAPLLFQVVGFNNDASLFSSVMTTLVNVLGTLVSVIAINRFGRRKLLLQASVQMLICNVTIGAILHVYLKKTGSLDKGLAWFVVVLACLFVLGFAWSWGPLSWLIPSEILPLETRTAGISVAISSNMFFTFCIAQFYLSMLCHMQASVFILFAAWILVMGLFVLFLLPETKDLPVDSMNDRVWKKHPLWKKFMGRDITIVSYDMV